MTSPVTSIWLHGKFTLTGIALPSLGAGENPADTIELAGYCFGTPYKNTPRLQAPSFLEAKNTQTRWLPNEKKAPEGLGFVLHW